MGDIISAMRDILSTMEDTQYRGEIMMDVGISRVSSGCSVPWGKFFVN